MHIIFSYKYIYANGIRVSNGSEYRFAGLV